MLNNFLMNLLIFFFNWGKFDRCFKGKVGYILVVKKIIDIVKEKNLIVKEKLKRIGKVLVFFGIIFVLMIVGGMVLVFFLFGGFIGSLIVGLFGSFIVEL